VPEREMIQKRERDEGKNATEKAKKELEERARKKYLTDHFYIILY
jgi:hypothetical protein